MAHPEDSFAGLPVFSLDLDISQLDFSGGDAFWPRMETLVKEGRYSTHLDTCLSGRSAPRVWTILFDEDQARLAMVAAFSMASELAGRDQSVLVLDGDDHQGLLTQLSGRNDSHGWIDMARYGASILTCGDALPFAGRRSHLLGVGSFAPTDVTGVEIQELLTRLRRQADDIIVLTPLNHTGRLWDTCADIRLLCWDRTRLDETGMIRLVEGLTTERALNGLMAAGEPLAAAEPAPTPPVEVPVESGPDVESGGESEIESEIESVIETGIRPESQAAAADSMAALLAAEDTPAGESFPEEGPAHGGEGRRTSRIFWGAAVVSVVVILAASIYWAKFLRVPTDGYFEEVPISRSLSDIGTDAGESKVPILTEQAAVPAAVDSTDSGAVADVDSLLVAADSVAVAPVTVDPPEVVAETPPDDPLPAQPEPEPEPGETGPVFSLDPYRVEVGRGGWAIHVYSLADSTAAARQSARLNRRGFKTAVRTVEVADKGWWFRIYLGSFATRDEARRALPLLLEKLGETWAQVQPFADTP